MLRCALSFLFAGMLAIDAAPALAQYIWVDEKGVKQLSDRPPPPSVPARRILKTPGAQTPLPEQDAAPTPPAPASTMPSVAEREADFQKRRADANAANNKANNEAQLKADEAANCNAARQNQRALDEGLRITSYDKDGNRVIMSDDERAELAKKSQKVLAACK